MFRVGQKVVCVRDWGHQCSDTYPIKNAVYTVRGVVDSVSKDGPETGLLLEEIYNQPRLHRTINGNRVCECCFWFGAFRPLIDLSDLESIVTEVMRGKPRKIQDDKFDKQRIHSAAPLPLDVQRDARTPAAPAGGFCDGLSRPFPVGLS